MADSDTFEKHRPSLLELAYQMLGDMACAEDAVREAWVRWERRAAHLGAPGAFLVTTVAFLCLRHAPGACPVHLLEPP